MNYFIAGLVSLYGAWHVELRNTELQIARVTDIVTISVTLVL